MIFRKKSLYGKLLKKIIFTLVFFCMSTPGVMSMAEPFTDIIKKLPLEVPGWTVTGEDVFYNPGNLHNYINGGAELYISYDFKKLLSRKYSQGEGSELTFDIFDMGNSYNAFGVFSHSAEEPDVSAKIGQGSEYASGLLTFWKDRYYVSILAYPETEEKRRSILKLGRDLAAAIPADGPLPPVLSLLPRQNLIKKSVRYFYHYIWLNSYFFISNSDILGLDKDTGATLAKYEDNAGKGSYFVLLAQYPDPKRAAAGLTLFLKSYFKDTTAAIAKQKDGRWAGAKGAGNLVIIVLKAPSRETVEAVFRDVSATLESPKEEPSKNKNQKSKQ
ncbi:MAG: hypothetical protein GY757_31315 [bacterium]|nr:hypothetical protein [bacterium]